MDLQNDYDSPGVATIFPLWSRYAEDVYTDLVNKIGTVLKEKNLIQDEVKLKDQKEPLVLKLEDYLKKYPVRKHSRHWVDGGEQIAGVHPYTYIPFFINPSGSLICRLFDGQTNVLGIIEILKGKWDFLPEEVVVNDLLPFLFLLEELDLLEFRERSQ